MSDSTFALDANQNFWWKICMPAISGLMDHAGTYTPDQKNSNLRFFAEQVTPLLGSKPPGHLGKDASPMDVCSPVEASLNFTSNGKPMMRAQFEPLVVTNPLGQQKTREMLSQIAKQLEGHGVDMRWTNQFVKSLIPTSPDEIARAVMTNLPHPLDHALTLSMGFDYHGSTRKMKTYFYPMAKSFATGQSTESLVYETIRKLQPYGADLAPAVDYLERYVPTCPAKLNDLMIGLDCSDPSKARVKVYAYCEANSWNFIRHVNTFGETATDKTRLEGLDILQSIWHLFLCEKVPPNADFDKPLRQPGIFGGGLVLSFEIVAGRPVPEVKTYVPMWQYAESEGMVVDNLVAIFRKIGWHSVADEYLAKLRKTFPGLDLDGPARVHSDISFAYSQKSGVYMSVYYCVSGKATHFSVPMSGNGRA